MTADPTFVMRVLTLFAMFPHDSTEMLMWRVDGKYAPLTFMVSCSDFFWWGTADCEVISPDEIEPLEQAFADVTAASTNGQMDAYWGSVLYVARKRGLRPQGAAYPTIPALAALFDACGPERTVGLGNPKRPAGLAGESRGWPARAHHRCPRQPRRRRCRTRPLAPHG